MSAFIDYCMSHPILTAILIGSGVLMLLLSGMILAMPDQEESKAQIKQENQKDEPVKEAIKTDEVKEAVKEEIKPAKTKSAEIKDEPLPAKDVTPKAERKKKSETLTAPVMEEPLKTAPVKEESTKESLKESVKEEPIKAETLTEKPAKKPASRKKAEPKQEETPAVMEKATAETAAEITEEKPKRTRKTKAETEGTESQSAPLPEKKTTAKTTKTQKNPTPDLKKESKEQEMLLDDLNSVENVTDFYEEDETDRIAKYSGKWVICRVVTEENSASHVKNEEDETYFFELRASNGEKLFSSEEYTTYNGALRGIETHKTNIAKNNFKIVLSKKGDYIFKLLSGKNLILSMGENYPTKSACESAIESTKRFAQTAVLDENIQDHVVKVPIENEKDLLPLPDGFNGKWVISARKSLDEEDIYYFELFASNGEKLLCSEDYTTYVGAVNGIQTHKANITDGNFRITLTKRGDYIYKLLNKNGQLLCLGEHYKTKQRCLNAVESVKRFAVNSPVLTNLKLDN